uniref:Integral membrane protein 2 n=1 Tax=Psorophora albipes TaxID=869069 RepID=T1DIC3_9DIPT
MTILTKGLGDAKKPEKTVVPLVGVSDVPVAPTAPSDIPHDSESAASSIILIRRSRRISSATTYILFLIALLVTSLGIIAGVFYYRQYAHSRNHLRFHGFCQIPYDSSSLSDNNMYYMNQGLREEADDSMSRLNLALHQQIQELFRPLQNDFKEMEAQADQAEDELNDKFFKEEFELSEEENYSKIDVPVFRGNRQGRFLHDFKFNQSTIIDRDNGRCFLMPLDRETVLPPKSLRDLVEKMWNGYYNINTQTIRKNMRVITPELEDLSDVSPRITKECEDMKIYRLEKIVSGVFKRSADLHEHAKFAEFGGNFITVIDIQNLEDITN